MFELVSNISEVKFVSITDGKQKEEWRDELIGFGLKMDSRFFSISEGKAPIYLAFADASYTKTFGNRPRISIVKDGELDPTFKSVCKKYGITYVNNYGGTIEGYDFTSTKTAQELCSFLVGFEQAYCQLKFAA
jgi:hypothetical protein